MNFLSHTRETCN